jgi:putative transposase
VNRRFATTYNRKRVRRVMELAGGTLPTKARRRSGRAHTGRVARDGSNGRWCSDSLQVACWNGQVVEIGFVLDCCDRECLAVVAQPCDLAGADIRALMQAAVQARLGGARPLTPIQWLSDNEGMYTALATVICAERLGLEPITTPAYSPESNGVAEAFVKTLKRDYVSGAELTSAAVLLAQLPSWVADYNGIAPHSALGYLTPLAYRARQAVETAPEMQTV